MRSTTIFAWLASYGVQNPWRLQPYSKYDSPLSPDTRVPVRRQSLISNETSSYIEHLIGEWNSTGLAVAVVQKDETINDPAHPGWRIEYGSYGHACTHPSSKPMTPDTLFSIASNSKLFLSISVGLLIHNETLAESFKAEHGVELGWKTRMRDLLGEDWEMWDGDVTTGATIADLLAHRTGLPRHDYMRVWRNGGILEEIQKLRYLRPSAEFRETFQYNNLMYETLSYLPEVLLNQTYESYVTEHLLEPLNMSSTTFSVADVYERPLPGHGRGKFADRMAQGHIASERDLGHGKLGTLKPIVPFFSKPGEERTRAGAGGVISTSRDLATWNAMLLSNGRHPYTNATVVPPEVLEWITTGRSVAFAEPRFPDTSPIVYNAGQMRFSYRGLDVIQHDGDNPGFKSVVARYPQKGLGVVALSNDGENGGSVFEAAKWAVVDDLVFGDREERVNWSGRLRSRLEDQRRARLEGVTPRPRDPEPLTKPFEHLGRKRFSHPAYGEIVPCRVPASQVQHVHSPSLSTEAPPAVFQGQFPVSMSLSMEDKYENPHTKCTELLSSPSVQHILSYAAPNSKDSNLPERFVASFPHSFASHLLLQHFNGDLFNVSVVWANSDVRREGGVFPGSPALRPHGDGDLETDTDDVQDPGAVLTGLDETFTLEWVHGCEQRIASCDGEEGLAVQGGFWGMAGPDAREPVGTGREGAEVWFEVIGE